MYYNMDIATIFVRSTAHTIIYYTIFLKKCQELFYTINIKHLHIGTPNAGVYDYSLFTGTIIMIKLSQ